MSTKYRTVRPNKKTEEGTKVYEYEYDHKKYYEHYKEKKGRSVCPICCSEVSNIYLAKHQATSRKCLKAGQVKIGDEEKQELIQKLMDTIQQFTEKHSLKN